MRSLGKTIARLGLAAALGLALAPACSTERLILDLEVAVAPNPVVGVADGGERRWDFTLTVRNPNGVGVVLDSYHRSLEKTDTGYSFPLIIEEVKLAETEKYIPAGQAKSFATQLKSEGRYASGTMRRLYHARGDDGKYYSGEVFLELR